MGRRWLSSPRMMARAAEAIPLAKRIGSMKLGTSRRVRALKSKVLSKDSYGVEATQLPESVARRLQSTVLDAARRFRSRTRAPALALYAADTPALDVKAEILKRRLRHLARRLGQEADLRNKVREIMEVITQYHIDNPKGPIALI